ncbi:MULTISPECIES: ABC transporter ATP-binding protein [Vagococcus]|uniref:Ferrichrome transport ATP-binding protein FhuC (TC 3.A.1.14.3) n=1 Tax=Vagococcus fluvialis bH819 TaxID=1255619 RepID=A0A1X6WLE0_9ENTE|nr:MULTISPECIES: ABC transporter ATP-binding protein [Vagococcus]SLM85087.1 Ferrichrome transport ATP-binding protein FhuC (TC 3.A.1.14.3) [Vagococcus fluvialis bH819]HCM88497.1 ABC transporter ATP-binding protein [Vagococcus sp.]
MNRIETKKLTIAYDDQVIVDSLDLVIPKGKVTSIIGPNGCGKSTILKTIGRILKKKSGMVYLDGEDISKASTKEIAQKMAILPQSPTAPSGLTVQELVSYGRFPHQKGFGKLDTEDKKLIEWAIDVTKLTHFKNREIDSLSGGQRQRVWIAMALAQQTELILLDEPTTYLDMAHQLEILELLDNLNKNQGCTIVMVLHDLNLASRFSDYLVAVNQGEIRAVGSAKEVITKEVLRNVFQINATIVEEPINQYPVCLTYDLIK